MLGCTLNCTDQQPRVRGEGFTQMADFQKDRKKNNASVLYRVYACVYARVCACMGKYKCLFVYMAIYLYNGILRCCTVIEMA